MIDILNFFSDFTLLKLVMCLINGYIFTGVFEYISSHPSEKDYSQNILKNILVGYALMLVYNILPSWTNNEQLNTFIFWFLCILVSYVCAQFFASKYFIRVCEAINIYKTPNRFIWNSIIARTSEVIWVRCLFYDLDLDITGQLLECEEFRFAIPLALADG